MNIIKDFLLVNVKIYTYFLFLALALSTIKNWVEGVYLMEEYNRLYQIYVKKSDDELREIINPANGHTKIAVEVAKDILRNERNVIIVDDVGGKGTHSIQAFLKVMKNKWKLILIIVVIFGGFIWHDVGSMQIKSLNENLTVLKTSWIEENILTQYNKNGFMIENNNGVPVDVVLTVNVYDSNGGFSHTDKIEVDAVAPESDFFFEREYGSSVERVELKDYECKKSRYQALNEGELEVSTDTDGKRMKVSVKNNSGKDTSGCICTIVFYVGEQVIKKAETIELHNGKIPAGETAVEEILCPLTNEYGSMEIYTNAYILK